MMDGLPGDLAEDDVGIPRPCSFNYPLGVCTSKRKNHTWYAFATFGRGLSARHMAASRSVAAWLCLNTDRCTTQKHVRHQEA